MENLPNKNYFGKKLFVKKSDNYEVRLYAIFDGVLSLTTLRRLIIQSFCREHLKVGQKLGIFRDEIFKSKIQSFSCLRTERTEKFMTTAQQEGNSNGPRPTSFIWVDERLGGYYFATEGYFCII